MQSAYYQVRLKPEDIPKTAFTTPMGLFEFKVLCFGLTNAPGTFQNIMNDVLRDILGKFVIVYLDDIVVFSNNRHEHYKHLTIVLQLLRQHELYANLAKCKFVQPELHFLGHIVGAQGLRVDPQKVAIVQNWPVPKDRTSLQKFWGLANYFRKFIMGWANLVSALQQQLKKTDTFQWNADCDAAFTGLKNALCNAPVLALPDLNKPFEVICDACGVGVGAVLLQEGRPIAFDGKRLSPAEQNYSVGEQELLAVLHALELWRCYLDGTQFTVVTDHSPNTFFATKALLSPRQTRWAERLSRFQFIWEYRPGRVNVADPLSRHPSFSANTVYVTAVTADLAHLSLTAITDADMQVENDTEAENAEATDADSEMLSQIIQGYSKDPWFASANNTALLEIYQGLYYKGDALVVPDMPELKRTILRELHDANYAGHVGTVRTIHNVQRMYWWPSMHKEIREYVRGCKVCQQDKHLQSQPAGKLVPLPVSENAWDYITADRIVSLPKTKQGFTAILVVVDRLTKMAHFMPCKNESSAKDIARLFVDNVWKYHGMPLRITTDRGPEFTNKFIAALCELVGTDHCKSTAYHPQSDGQTERMNRVLEDMLRHYVNPRQNNWDELLSAAEFAVNNSYQASIQDTPFYLNYGRHPRLPSDLTLSSERKKAVKDKDAVDFIGNIEKAVAKAKVCLQAAQHRQKKYADKTRSELQFNIGEMVWLSSRHVTLKAVGSRKLLPQWLGPFRITAKPSTVNYTLELPEHYRIHDTFHVSMLRRYYDNGAGVQRPPTVVIEGQEEFEVQEILAHKPLNKTRHSTNVRYLVQWKGYGPAYNSWEPVKELAKHAPLSLSDYWDEVEAAQVQAAESQHDSDTGLAPSDHHSPDSPSRGSGRTRSRGRGPNIARRRTSRHGHHGRGHSLRPVRKKLKKLPTSPH